jgi:hypothetical protein
VVRATTLASPRRGCQVGLSMDSQVFLLSRIHERYRQTGSTRKGIIHGVGSTARLITGAALIIVVVFVGFATGEVVAFQQMGFGVAVALLVDATVATLGGDPGRHGPARRAQPVSARLAAPAAQGSDRGPDAGRGRVRSPGGSRRRSPRQDLGAATNT